MTRAWRKLCGLAAVLALLCFAAGCVPGPAELLKQLTLLDRVALIASVQHKAACSKEASSEREATACGELISCLTVLGTTARTCSDAIAQGRTNRDGVYNIQARECARASRVTQSICPKLPASAEGPNDR